MILAHKTRIRTANPGSAIANALAQHDGAARWAYNNLLASLKDGIESSSGGLWPSVGGLAKTLRREKPAWWASVDWEMLDNGRLRLDTASVKCRTCWWTGVIPGSPLPLRCKACWEPRWKW